MDITPKPATGKQPIQGYGNGGFRIAERRVDGAMLALPDKALAWPVTAMAEITAESLAPLRESADDIDLLLLGCGARIVPLDGAVRREVRGWGINIELMDTGAACRTYNVLLLEERRVAAALLPV